MAIHAPHALPRALADLQVEIEEHARGHGLDFYPTIFELVDCEQMNEIAAFGGFPTRYPHWRFGMEYEQLAKGYAYGLQKIYELVINNDPCYAYLLASNALTDQKLVMAHVYGHCDFFKNNAYFAATNRKMMDQMANHGNRVRRHMDRFGVDEVEAFIDCCLSIEDLIDAHSTAIQRSEPKPRRGLPGVDDESEPEAPGRFPAKGYLDRFVNPPGALAEEVRFPTEPTRDVMLFVLEHAPLKAWQLDVLSIVRDEAYYFAPQGQTKIMNEGWASYWHSTIMTRQALEAQDVVHYCDHHSGTLATSPGRLNPYKLGIELFRDIEERWDKGRRRAGAGAVGHRRGGGAAEDFRGAARTQRPDVHRHVSHAGFLPPAQAVFLRLPQGGRRLADRKPRISQGQAAFAGEPDEPRAAADLRARRELQEPRGAVLGARFRRRGPAAELRAGHAGESGSAVDAAGASRDDRRRRVDCAFVRREGTQIDFEQTGGDRQEMTPRGRNTGRALARGGSDGT
jgi:SpoVR like protein